MNPSILALPALSVFLGLAVPASAASSGPRFYGDAPDTNHPWAVHDRNRPEPARVVPGTFSTLEAPGRPPSDAIVLFDGANLSGWQTDKGGPAPWLVKDGVMEVVPGSGQIQTRDQFGDCQLHVEWAAPAKVEGSGQGRGNSGIFLMGRLEVQVLDSYDNSSYADGHAGSYYGVNPPLVLPLQPPGVFQVYDIVFRRPIYRDGQLVDPGYVTVFVNGVLAQDHTPIEGPTGHMGRSRPSPFPERGPLALQDHGNPMRFRNIWYRPLPPRASEGGTDGFLSAEATLAKRAEIAAGLRKDAAATGVGADPVERMLLLMESQVYAPDAATSQEALALATDYVRRLRELPASEVAGRKDQAKYLSDVFKYLLKFKVVSEPFPPEVELQGVIKAQGWDKRPGR